MIEIYRKGFRLDIPKDQVFTFKKSQNLNGVQERYAYSNNVSVEKTANIIKLLDLPELPTGKVNTLQNGYVVDVVLNGSIYLRSQKLKISKESRTKVDLYLLYSDASLVTSLKETYINNTTKELRYTKGIADFTFKSLFNLTDPPFQATAFVKTQSDVGYYVIEEMPQLINIQKLIRKIFEDADYSVYGDFFQDDNGINQFYVAPNAGIYQVYDNISEGFSPSFDVSLTAWQLLNQTLAYFNCYATFNDTDRNVIINQWSNLRNYKSNFKDYSKYYVDYQDYSFQSKLAKRNELTYSDSETTFNSFFTNNLSSEDKAVYLGSKFGSGSTKLFSDSEINDDETALELRQNGELGETSALRIYKLSEEYYNAVVYSNGLPNNLQARKAVSVSMRAIYNDYHKSFTAFILSPLIQNVIFKYDDILVNEFSLTDVFFIEQLASYWIPLEINFSTKKDEIKIRAMLIKERKAKSPILNNFNSVLLNFRQRVVFPKSYLLSMYPMPPNEYEWDEVIFKNYDPLKNRLFVNNILVPAESLPQAFNLSTLSENAIEIEANLPGETTADTFSDSLYIQAVDTEGGISNEAYINLVHTGIAELESNFIQNDVYIFSKTLATGQSYKETANVLSYISGSKPNINNTVISVVPVIDQGSVSTSAMNLISTIENYSNLKVKVNQFSIKVKTQNQGSGRARLVVRMYLIIGAQVIGIKDWTAADNSDTIYSDSGLNYDYNIAVPIGTKIRVVFFTSFKNEGGLFGGAAAIVEVSGLKVDISTIKTI